MLYESAKISRKKESMQEVNVESRKGLEYIKEMLWGFVVVLIMLKIADEVYSKEASSFFPIDWENKI